MLYKFVIKHLGSGYLSEILIEQKSETKAVASVLSIIEKEQIEAITLKKLPSVSNGILEFKTHNREDFKNLPNTGANDSFDKVVFGTLSDYSESLFW